MNFNPLVLWPCRREPGEDDDLVDRLLESNPSFRALVEKSKASPRSPFPRPPDS